MSRNGEVTFGGTKDIPVLFSARPTCNTPESLQPVLELSSPSQILGRFCLPLQSDLAFCPIDEHAQLVLSYCRERNEYSQSRLFIVGDFPSLFAVGISRTDPRNSLCFAQFSPADPQIACTRLSSSLSVTFWLRCCFVRQLAFDLVFAPCGLSAFGSGRFGGDFLTQRFGSCIPFSGVFWVS